MRKMIYFIMAALVAMCALSGCSPTAGESTSEPPFELTPDPAWESLPALSSEPIAESSAPSPKPSNDPMPEPAADVSDIHLTVQGDEVDGAYHEFQLSYRTQIKQFAGTHMVWWDSPHIYTVDLNGNHVEEIVVVLAAGHGTGCLIEELHIFDAATLQEYDCANAFDIIEDTLNFYSDAENYYIQAPSNLFAVPKSTFHIEPNLRFDSIGIGEFVTFSVDSDGLFCTLGCQIVPDRFCGNLDVRLGLDQDSICCLDYDYSPLE